jgi:lipopolysaccharide transport system permease protein
MSEPAVRIIKAQRGFLRIDFALYWQYRDLLWSFVVRNITVRYRQTILGPLWLVIQPLAMSGILAIVLAGLAKVSTNGRPASLFYLLGMILWGYFSGVVLAVSDVFINNEYLFSRVYFPRLLVPLAVAVSNSVGVGIQLVMFFTILLFYALFGGYAVQGIALWLMPLAFAQTMLFAVGVGLLIASSTAKYRDMANAIPFVLQAGLFLTPALYAYSAIPPQLRVAVATLNPLSVSFDLWRSAIFGQLTASGVEIMLSCLSALVVFVCGVLVFQQVERTATDTI